MRSGEHPIGTNVGVFRLATVRLKPADAKWSANRIAEMQGSPKQPVPGQASRRSPAFARKFEASVAMDVALAPMVDSANQLARVTDKFNNSRIFSDQ